MKILFITHETSRTGAPMVMLHFLKWIQANKPGVMVDVLDLNKGALATDFKNVCYNYYDYKQWTRLKKIGHLKHLLFLSGFGKKTDSKSALVKHLVKNNYQVIYANTVVAVPMGCLLKSNIKSSRLVAHVHELNAIIQTVLPNFKNYIKSIDQFIVPSKLVKTNLVDHWCVGKNKVSVVYECSSVAPTYQNPKENKIFTVGASGTVHWRKGQDVFVQLARYIIKHYPEVKVQFVWVGRIPYSEHCILKEDLRKLNLSDTVSFVGEQNSPSDYYQDFDVFVMTSREDPFPLVCIEVGLMGKPIVSFRQATGTNEFLEQSGGYIVPYLDIEAMAEKIVTYYKHPELKKAHGDYNKDVFSQFVPEQICPQLFKQINFTVNHA